MNNDLTQLKNIIILVYNQHNIISINQSINQSLLTSHIIALYRTNCPMKHIVMHQELKSAHQK